MDPSPAPSSSDDAFLMSVGIDPAEQNSWSLPAADLILIIIATAVAVLILRAIYRGMQRPRLNLTMHEDAPPTVSANAIARYAVTPLVLIPLWFMAILSILVLAAGRSYGVRPGNELVIATGAVVGGSRLLAYVNREGAHELAKSVPLTLLSLIIISGQVVTAEGAAKLFVQLVLNIDSLLAYMILLGLLDIALTTGWFLWVRWRWNAPDNDTGSGLWHRLRATLALGWGSRASGPAAAPVQEAEN